ncbi:MAG: hypothetical protein D6736_15255 [Nitrospinota bacterium]|nr:MAG: hypothetical protein D6736_15255 [Nitrospinota bacterium]
MIPFSQVTIVSSTVALPPRLAAESRDGGSRQQRRDKTIQAHSTMTRNQLSVSPQEPPGPTRSGRCTAQSANPPFPSPIDHQQTSDVQPAENQGNSWIFLVDMVKYGHLFKAGVVLSSRL